MSRCVRLKSQVIYLCDIAQISLQSIGTKRGRKLLWSLSTNKCRDCLDRTAIDSNISKNRVFIKKILAFNVAFVHFIKQSIYKQVKRAITTQPCVYIENFLNFNFKRSYTVKTPILKFVITRVTACCFTQAAIPETVLVLQE